MVKGDWRRFSDNQRLHDTFIFPVRPREPGQTGRGGTRDIKKDKERERERESAAKRAKRMRETVRKRQCETEKRPRTKLKETQRDTTKR